MMNKAISATLLTFVAIGVIATATLSQLSYAADADIVNATLTAPILKDATGKELSNPAKVGQLVIISTSLASSGNSTNDSSVPFVIIIEARDELGISHYSQFALGNLNLGAKSEVGLSWIPKEAGTYELKAFALSDLNNPQILAPAHTSLTRVEQ